MDKLRDRVAIVTGGARGIGGAIASAFATEGADVVIADRLGEQVAAPVLSAIEAAGRRGLFVSTDVSDEASVRAMVDTAYRQFGDVDILVNNAGVFGQFFFHELTTEEWDRVIALNLRTAFSATRAALPALLDASPGGRIVFVSSVTGPLVSNPRSSGYAAAKAGLTGLARSLAVEYGRRGLTANCVLPGWIASGSQLTDEVIAGANTPIGRSGTVEEVAEAIAFLASPGASYVTGQTLVVDGGNVVQEYKGPPGDYY